MNVINKIEKISKRLKQINLLLQKARGNFDPVDFYTKAQVDALLAAQDELSELSDVNLGVPADQDVLTYDLAITKWISQISPGGGAAVGLKVFVSDFDSLANGNINGQGAYSYAGNWVNNSGAGCTAEIMADPGGGKMLRLHDASGANAAEAYIDLNSGYEILTGVIEWKMKVSVLAVDSRGYFFIIDKAIASNSGGFFRGDSTDIYYSVGGGNGKLIDVVVDTWYVVRMYFCRLANYAVWWADGVFERQRTAMNAGNKFDRLILKTRDIYSGNDFDIKYVKAWLLHYVI